MREEIATPPRSGGLPFRVQMSGISYCDGSYIIRRPSSKITCMEYILEGEGTVCEGERSFTAKKGDIYLLHEGKDHYYFSDGDSPWVKIWMNVTGPATEHLLYAYGLDRVNHIPGLNLEKDFRAFYETAKGCTTATEVSETCSLIFHRILHKIAEHLRDSAPDSTTARKMKEIIDGAKGYDITLEQLSKELFFTKTHLIRVFRAEYHITPYEYILSRKLRLAKDLLINTSLPITEIAAYLNFCDAHYFTNFFRSRTGIAPREYRKRDRNDQRKITIQPEATPIEDDIHVEL